MSRLDWVVSPDEIVRRCVLCGLLTVDEAFEVRVQNAAREEAESLRERWLEGEGFGSSDFTAVAASFLRCASIHCDYVNGRLIRINQEQCVSGHPAGEANVIHPDALAIMRRRDRSGASWYAYRNEAFDSSTFGHLIYLQCGEGCSFPEPPKRAPDGEYGIGWKYLPAGKVDLETGSIIELAKEDV